MVKQKAEDNPCIDAHCEADTPESTLPEELSQPEQRPNNYSLAGGEQCEGVSVCHMDPVQSDVAEAPGVEDDSFWGLLALIGYEVW